MFRYRDAESVIYPPHWGVFFHVLFIHYLMALLQSTDSVRINNTQRMEHDQHAIYARHMVGPTLLIAAGILPATAIFIPLGLAIYKSFTYTPR